MTARDISRRQSEFLRPKFAAEPLLQAETAPPEGKSV
jgi:hypothetical protein